MSNCNHRKLSPPGPSWLQGHHRQVGSSYHGSSCINSGCKSSQSPDRVGQNPAEKQIGNSWFKICFFTFLERLTFSKGGVGG